MHCIKNDKHALRIEPMLERVGDLLGEALLQLRARRQRLDDPRKATKADYSCRRHVGEVRGADEGQQMVLADGAELDVAQEHELAALALGKLDRVAEVVERVLVEAGEEVRVGLRHPLRRGGEARASGILADRSEELGYRRLNATGVDGHA